MSNQIPGVPEGWELVAIRKPVRDVDHILGPDLEPVLCDHVQQNFNCVIIRKIEKPATYRPFKDAEEADQFWNAALRYRSALGQNIYSRFRINTIGHDGITIGLEFYSYKAAFDNFCIDDDGTPFGVKIDE
jgi:hypothetical protein